MNYFIPSIFLSSQVLNTNVTDVTNGVATIAQALSNYGIAIVVMAVFFVIFLILIVIMLYSNAKMMNSIMKNNQNNSSHDQELLSKFVDKTFGTGSDTVNEIVQILSNKLDDSVKSLQDSLEKTAEEILEEEKELPKDDYHRDIIGSYIDINMTFKNISRTALNSIACDRIAIYVFHNGNKSLYGFPFFKMSCIHEWTKLGSNTLRGKSHTDIPLHAFNDFIEDLYRYRVYKSEDIDNAKMNNPSIKEFTSYSNTKAIYIVAVKNDENIITGFVSAEFDHVDTFESDDKRDLEVRAVMDDMVQKIAPLISTEYTYKPHEAE